MKTSGKLLIVFVLLSTWILSACAVTAASTIDGTWKYSMITTDGNTYDEGKIIFSAGQYVQKNIYAVDYVGSFSVNGQAVKLSGDETWQGTQTSANEMKGTWAHSDGRSGTWSATRVP